MPDQQKYTNKLHGARVLIVGGTSGIGFSVAEATLEHGAASVIISSSNPDKVSKSLDRLKKAYPSRESAISGTSCDLSKVDTLDANVEQLLKFATDNHAKKLDHVVFTAGDPLHPAPLSETPMNTVYQSGTVRYFGPIAIAKHLQLTKALKEGPVGSFTITTGTVGDRPIDKWVLNGGWASGLHGLTRSLAHELQPNRVNLINPGAVATELWDGLPPEQRKQFEAGVSVGTTTGQIGKPEDVAEAYLYAMKDYNLTGSVLSTNGGALLLGKGI